MLVSGVTPAAAPRIAVAGDGTHVAIAERGGEAGRCAVVRVVDGGVACELALPGGDADVAWIGSRIVVVATTESHTGVSLIDPASSERKLAEIRLETPMRLGAATGPHALLLGARTAAVLAGGESHLAPYQFLARTLPTVVGVAGGLFVVAMPGTIEEWDPISRMPKRRLRLPRAATITSLGGSERVLWMTTLQEPARLDVLPIVNRGQPKAHDLPESIKSVHGHPHSDVVVCIGAETGRVYAIDLDTRGRVRTIATGLDRADTAGLAVARGASPIVIAARTGQPVAIVALGDAEPEPTRSSDELPPVSSSLFDSVRHAAEALRGASGSSLGDSARDSRNADDADDDGSLGAAARQSVADRPPMSRSAAAAHAIATHGHAATAMHDHADAPIEQPAVPTHEPRPTAWSEGASELIAKLAALKAAGSEPGSPDAPQRASWRDDAGAWARAVASGTFDRAAPACPPIEALAERFELPEQLVPALVLLYGSHLAGLDGAAPMDVARVLGRRWDDALGRGKLAELGVARYAKSRVALAPAILRALDELPPATGRFVGELGVATLLGPCAVIGGESLDALAQRYAPKVGTAILIAHEGVDAAEHVLEARAFGGVPLMPVTRTSGIGAAFPVVVIVDDEAIAESLGLPML